MSLALLWNASSQTEVVKLLGEIRQRMDAQRLGLAEAYALIHNVPTAKAGRLNWEVIEQFMASREGRRATTLRDMGTRMDRTLQVLQRKPSP